MSGDVVFRFQHYFPTTKSTTAAAVDKTGRQDTEPQGKAVTLVCGVCLCVCSGLLASPSNASLFWALCVNSFVCVSRGWSLFLYLYSQLALCCSLSPSCVPLSSLPPLSQNRGTRQHQPLDTTVVTTSAAEPVSPLGCLPKEPSRGVPSLETVFLVAAGQKHTAWLAAIFFFGGHQRQHRLPAGVFPPVSARREVEKAKGKYNVRWSDRLLSGVCPGGYTCWPSS